MPLSARISSGRSGPSPRSSSDWAMALTARDVSSKVMRAPPARRIALGQEHAVRLGRGPALQPYADAARHSSQLTPGPDDDRAVGPPLVRHVRLREQAAGIFGGACTCGRGRHGCLHRSSPCLFVMVGLACTRTGSECPDHPSSSKLQARRVGRQPTKFPAQAIIARWILGTSPRMTTCEPPSREGPLVNIQDRCS